MKLMLAALRISSTHISTVMKLRRTTMPTTPSVKRTSESTR